MSFLPSRAAGVGQKGGAVNEAGLTGGEEKGNFGDFFGLADSDALGSCLHPVEAQGMVACA